jgi:hypothetical protein
VFTYEGGAGGQRTLLHLTVNFQHPLMSNKLFGAVGGGPLQGTSSLLKIIGTI